MRENYDVGLTGLWFANDYGNVLSYYILYKTLEKLGYSVLMLGDYDTEKDDSITPFLNRVYAENTMPIQGNQEQINAICKRFLLGSGQSLNYGIAKHFADAFYLSFSDNSHPRIAYSVSFGHDRDFVPAEKFSAVSAAFHRFSSISSREVAVQQYLKQTYGIPTTVTLDPLLLQPALLQELAQQSYLTAQKPYILLQLLDENPALEQAVAAYAERNDLELLVLRNTEVLSVETFSALFGTETNLSVSVEDYVSLLAQAAFVVSDSFSCCSLSLALQKTAYGFVNHKRGAVRFIECYQRLGISDFLLQNYTVFQNDTVPQMDFAPIEAQLLQARSASLQWLTTALQKKADSAPLPLSRDLRTAAERRTQLYQTLTERPIVLIGGGNNAKAFCEQFDDLLHIRCILSTFPNEKSVCLQNGKSYPVSDYHPSKIMRNDYIILCRGDVQNIYKNDRTRLVQDGFAFRTDFISSRLASAILSHKKLLTIVGYCQMDVIRDIYNRLPEVTEVYDLRFFRLSRDTIRSSYKFEDCLEQVRLSDILCYIPLFAASGKTDIDFLQELASDAITCTFPRLAFRGLHPYKANNLETFHELTRCNGHVHWPFLYQESIIDDLVLAGKSNDEIYQTLMREDLIPEKEIRKNLKLAFKSIQISECHTDIQMLDYIKEHYQQQHLYKDCLHYQNCMYFEIARRMNQILGLYVEQGINELEQACKDENLNFIDFTEIPILPCVEKALGITYADDAKQYRVRNFNGTISLMTRKEWIQAYADYTRSILQVKKFFNL